MCEGRNTASLNVLDGGLRELRINGFDADIILIDEIVYDAFYHWLASTNISRLVDYEFYNSQPNTRHSYRGIPVMMLPRNGSSYSQDRRAIYILDSRYLDRYLEGQSFLWAMGNLCDYSCFFDSQEIESSEDWVNEL